MFYSLKRHSVLDSTERNKLKEIFNILTDRNKEILIKQAKRLKLLAILSPIVLGISLIILGLAAILVLGSIPAGLIFFLLTSPFIYQLYCASTWKNIEDFEHIRIVGIDFVKVLLSKQ